ncbi:SAM-dependent methyltransferase, partial [Klebsiella michiganensis]|nr:SAM-dependent methyltransferase [Klebsiella michiganensis]
ADRNRSHWSTSKTPSYTKSVSWQHHPTAIERLRFKTGAKIVRNGVFKRENGSGFLSMLRFIQRHKRHLNFIACCYVKTLEVKNLK